MNKVIIYGGWLLTGLAAGAALTIESRPSSLDRPSAPPTPGRSMVSEISVPTVRPSTAPQVVNASSTTAANVVDYYSCFNSQEVATEIRVKERSWPDGSTSRDLIEIEIRELPPGGAAFVRSTETTSIAGNVLDVHCRSANDFFLAIEEGGRLHIDRWIRFPAKGEWESTLAIAQAGAPVATPAHQISISGGGEWIPPGTREAASPMRRLRINQLGSPSEFQGLGVDPDGRFYFVIWSDRVEQFSVDAGATGTTVVDSATPIDLTTLSTLTPLDTSTHGRIYYAPPDFETLTAFDLVIFDADNDGQMDGVNVIDRGDRDSLGPILQSLTRVYNSNL
ncbi:MAG: hypothetical protein VXY57_05230 [Actinomycetota bacterium]|nr:hypothetical protein [Actinomycetota bacterium]